MLASPHASPLAGQLKQQALAAGFAVAGIVRVDRPGALPARTAALERWLQAGHQASMAWMNDPRRRRIETLLPGVRSLLAVGLNYWIGQQQRPGVLRIGRYGWGRDYHRTIDRQLRTVGRWLSQQAPQCRWRVCVDHAPLLDKAWAEAAGLGWIGKHSNLIHQRHGSWLLIGHLLTTLDLPADQPHAPLCGRCTRCMEACPTGAISEPFVVNSHRCIAFHTTENRSPVLPTAMANALEGWIAGCDICQEVCPWNGRATSTSDPERQPARWILETPPEQLLEWNHDIWDQRLRGSALRRIKPWMWRRNIKACLAVKPTTPTSRQPASQVDSGMVQVEQPLSGLSVGRHNSP